MKKEKINLGNVGSWVVSLLYLTVYAIFMGEPLMVFTNDIYAFALLLTFGLSVFELRLAMELGNAIAYKKWPLAIATGIAGLLMIGFMTVQQSKWYFGMLIGMLFLGGVIFSYKDELRAIRDMITGLQNKLIVLRSDLVSVLYNLKEMERSKTPGSESIVEEKANALRKAIATRQLNIKVLDKELQNYLQLVQNDHDELAAMVRRIYGEFGADFNTAA